MTERHSNRINEDRWVLGKRCPFAKTYDIFQNKKSNKIGLELSIYRNVFCNRGEKGWKNCELYPSFKTINTKTEL